MRVATRFGLGLVGLVLLMQLVGPGKENPPVDPAARIEAHVSVPGDVQAILNRSCKNCHSHETQWPWYSDVAPVAWFVRHHVNHGRREMNLSDWGRYSREEAIHLLQEMHELVEGREMPLPPYLWMHGEAHLTDGDIRTFLKWTEAAREELRQEKVARESSTKE